MLLRAKWEYNWTGNRQVTDHLDSSSFSTVKGLETQVEEAEERTRDEDVETPK